MDKQKNQAAVPSDAPKANPLGLLTLLITPFYIPAGIVTGGLKSAGPAAGTVILAAIVGNAVYFGIAFGLSKYNPKKTVMNHAVILWAIVFIGCIVYILSKKDEKNEPDPSDGKYSKSL